jgi:hypothetical protein
MLHFTKTDSQDPCKEYELYLAYLPLAIYWPTKEVHEYIIADLRTMNGLDVEANAINELAEQLIDMFPPYAMNLPMTKLELSVALSGARRAAHSRLSPKP